MEVVLYFRDKYKHEFMDKLKIVLIGPPKRVERVVDTIRRTIEDWDDWVET